jgi:uncharacterized protein
MKNNDLPMSEAELDRLSELLDSDLTPEDCMDISMLQGYLTALLIGPDLPDPDEWLAAVWGEGPQARHFAVRAEADEVVDLVVRFYNELANELTQKAQDFDPILYLDEESGQQVCRPWCLGFVLGAALREDMWLDLIDDAEQNLALLPILDCADEGQRAALEEEGEDLALFEDDLSDQLGDCVLAIREYWLARQSAH